MLDQLTGSQRDRGVLFGIELGVLRSHAAGVGAPLPGVEIRRELPSEYIRLGGCHADTAVVALTHDPKLDDLALMEALKSPAFYVGAIGSRVNQAKRRARLAEHFGLTEAELDRLHGPVGLNIGARTPPEIALSILAEMTAVRYQAGGNTVEAGCAL